MNAEMFIVIGLTMTAIMVFTVMKFTVTYNAVSVKNRSHTIAVRKLKEVMPEVYTQGEQFDHFFVQENLSRALARLEIAITHFKPDYIIGVNNGGMHLAKFFGERLCIDGEKIIEVFVDASSIADVRNSDFVMRNLAEYPPPNFNADRIIFVDDIVRTGRTFKLIRRHMSLYENENIKYSSLAALIDHHEDIDYFGSLVSNANIVFTWTPEERVRKAKENEFRYKEMKKANIFDKNFEQEVDKSVESILRGV